MVSISRQLYRANQLTIFHGDTFVGGGDCTGSAGILNGILRKPTGIGKIFSGGRIRTEEELVHFPVIPDKMSALQLLDDFPDGELPCGSCPVLVLWIVVIENHERIGMPKYPTKGMHRSVTKHSTGKAGGGLVAVQISNGIGAGQFSLVTGKHFTRSIQPMLQTVHNHTIEVMWGCVDRAMGRGYSNLRIAVIARTAMHIGLSHCEVPDSTACGTQIEGVCPGSHHQQGRCREGCIFG